MVYKNITKLSDYVGFVNLPKVNSIASFFDSLVNVTERTVLSGVYCSDGLLGKKIYTELIADLDANNTPQTQRFIDLVTGKTYNKNGIDRIFVGIKTMLTYFVYSEFLKTMQFVETGTGLAELLHENSKNVSRKEINYRSHLRWNRGVDIYNGEAYQFLQDFQGNYTGWFFNKQHKFITHGII